MNKRHFTCLIFLFALSFSHLGFAQSPVKDLTFNHDGTSFPLDFAHARVSCDSCHISGVFSGTPNQCFTCHTRSSRIQASAPSVKHINTTQECEFCHQASSWESVSKVDHFAVNGSCQSCHNQTVAAGKSPSHIQSSEQCDDCHRSGTWLNAVFDHSDVSQPCSSCHNGVIAKGKSPLHIQSGPVCDDCHNTVSWESVTKFDHSSILGNCQSCHNGVTATGKNPQHIQSSNQCEDCHTTNGWAGASFDHNNITGSCTSCHNGVIATGKNPSHFITIQECDSCHNKVNWTNISFTHSSPGYPGDHRKNLDCTDCHLNNSETNTWLFPAYQPDCASCHADDYKAKEHEKKNGGFYTVTELKDCAGSCHKSSEHRVSDADWD